MPRPGSRTVSAATTPLAAKCRPQHPTLIIEDETHWRLQPEDAKAALLGTNVSVTRWRTLDQGTHEVCAETPAGYHVIGIGLRSINERLSVAGRTLWDGICMPGTLL